MVLKQLFEKKKTGSEADKKVPAMQQPEAAAHTESNTANRDEAQAPAAGEEPSVAQYLEKAMLENARNDNAETRYRVYQELLFSDLLLALAEPSAEGQTGSDSTVNVAILSNPQNTKFAAAFTSAAASKRWRPEGGNYVTMRGQDLYKLLEPSPAEVIVINPGSAPFIVLPKIEYRQLAAGIVPQSQRSPVQTSQAPAEPQVAFPPDVINADQKAFAQSVLETFTELDAAAFGIVLPPGAKPEEGWMRTLFLRVKDLNVTQEQGQKLFEAIHAKIMANEALFKEVGFQMVNVPDPGFWGLVQHNPHAVFFDHNPPPPAPAQDASQAPNQELQLAFPPDVFTPAQKEFATRIMSSNGKIEAAAVGAILPPGANKENGWVRTVFLRVTGIEETQEAMQSFCVEVRNSINTNAELFKDVGFEVGVMPDQNFWVAMTREKIALFDKNPPPVPAQAAGEGVVDASLS
jgi:hypothetical protein